MPEELLEMAGSAMFGLAMLVAVQGSCRREVAGRAARSCKSQLNPHGSLQAAR